MLTKTKTGFAQGFTTLDKETRIDNLRVQGTIPHWLNGSLIRNGPAQFEVGKRPFRHWFDGHAMLHRFGFAGGQVSYANRFLQTNARRGDMEAGTIAFGEFATDTGVNRPIALPTFPTKSHCVVSYSAKAR